MGSISANTAGGGYAYRASKAALNAVVKSFVIDVPHVQFLMLHPGRVETGLVEWKEEGAIGVQESVRDCMQVLSKMEEEEWESGRLVDRFGVVIPW
jgi:NAD(P)-dependent dehydrogenase (short-subunit alcohol dehydrogenase family)